MRLTALALAAFFTSLNASAAPIPYATAAQNVRNLLTQQFRIDPTEIRDTDSLRRDWLMDISIPELLALYEHRFQGPAPKRVMRAMKANCNNDSIRCVATGIAAASK